MRLDLIKSPLDGFSAQGGLSCLQTISIINEFLFLGLVSERDPPVPIPNTEVKPFSADGTARVAVWESRSRPD